ncbi:MAG: 4'-phosphopantetheinyl transferase superfamily protein [Lachnospiraceae bacterium]|nr:4'-phosphopantetheinyl transferase superfamily protein [Lachnospiraceae bacterium]
MDRKDSIVKEYTLGNSTLWLLCLQELSDEELKKMYACCSIKRREKTERMKSELKRKQSVGAGYLLFLLKQKFSIEEDPVALPGGKPVFQENKNIHFNISHSGPYAAIAFGKSPLGMDIECVKRANLKVAKRFFKKEEYDYLSEKEGIEQADAFYRIWTGKEAVAKASGAGLSMPFDRFSVLEKVIDCSENRYELCRQKFADGGQTLWISVAQTIT